MITFKLITNLNEEEAASFGRKAAFLAKVARLGVDTPGGYALRLPRPPLSTNGSLALLQWIEEVRDEWKGASVAVRSSTAWEDGPSASGAGQFLTKLHCRTTDAIHQAVIEVAEQAYDYAHQHQLTEASVGILLQPMIAGAYSGVCFTTHWMQTKELVIEYAEGECSGVVEGSTSSQQKRFFHSELSLAAAEPSSSFLTRVAHTCWALGNQLKMELDVEWTLTPENRLVILQARPITVDDPLKRKEELWEAERLALSKVTRPSDVMTSLSIGEVFGFPKPLFGDLIADALKMEGPLTSLFAKFGLRYSPNTTPCFTLFCARPFINLSAYARALGLNFRFSVEKTIRPSLRPWNLLTIARLVKALVRFPSLRRDYLRSVDERLHALRSWSSPSKGDFAARWSAAKAAMLHHYIPLHLEADVLSGLQQGLLLKGLTLLCGGQRRAIALHERLTFGLTNPNVETNIDLYRLGKKRLTWETFVERHGQRGHPDWDISAKRFKETPDKICLLAERVAASQDSPIEKEKRRQRRSQLLEFYLTKRWWYRWLRPYLEENARLIAYREKTQLVLYHQVDRLRQLVLHQAKKGDFPDELAFYLREEELYRLPQQTATLHGEAKRRQHLHTWQRGLAAPISFVAGRPKMEEKLPQGDQRSFQGLAISPGCFTGEAYVAQTLDEALQMAEGAILIIAHIDPAWSAVLCLAGAIVCEQGGLFCHSSILIREQGVPAVVNVPHITTAIQTGQRVTVDGVQGEVRLAKK